MCGRYTIKTPAAKVASLFDLDEVPTFTPRYNVAPTQQVPVVREADGKRHLHMLRWGLVPGWAKDLSIGSKAINARADTVAEKPMFRGAFTKRRCLVVADGFYEWKTNGKEKQPYRIHFKDERPFGFAGLWERWSKSDSPTETCTIITTDAAPYLEELHHRMPVILKPEQFGDWLTGKSGLEVLKPYEGEGIVFEPVRKTVNSVKNDSEACLERMDDLFS